MIVCGVDPGFASFGIVFVDLLRDTERVVHMDVIRTAPDARKRHVLSVDDNMRRLVQLSRAIWDLLDTFKPIAICMESASFPRNASSATKISMAIGACAAASARLGVPIIQASPQGVKECVCDRKDASKLEVSRVLQKRFGVDPCTYSKAPPSMHEHMWDALGAVVTCLDSDSIQLARNLL